MVITDRTVTARQCKALRSFRATAHAHEGLHHKLCGPAEPEIVTLSSPAATLVAHSPPRTVPSCRPPTQHGPRESIKRTRFRQPRHASSIAHRTAHTTYMQARALARLPTDGAIKNHRLHSQSCTLSSDDEARLELKMVLATKVVD